MKANPFKNHFRVGDVITDGQIVGVVITYGHGGIVPMWVVSNLGEIYFVADTLAQLVKTREDVIREELNDL